MGIERIFHCDGPDCDRRMRTLKTRPASGMLIVTGDGHPQHFCGWDCVLRHAATKEPEQVVSGPPSLDD